MKVNKHKSIKGCIKCGFTNHETKDCRFKFQSKCRTCSRDHMSHLCLKSSSNNNGKKNEVPNKTQINTVTQNQNEEVTVASQSTINIFNSTTSEDIALPTFTAQLVSKHCNANIRVFKDGGSQKNFICKKLASKLNLPVIEKDKSITIRGFVSKKVLAVDVVELSIKIGDFIHKNPAICVDSIATSFRVKNLDKIIQKFKNNGYKMADAGLINCPNVVGNISLIVGSESNHIIPSNDRIFGKKGNLSSFIDTPIGVMLCGGLNTLLNNLDLLPHNVSISSVEVSEPNSLSDDYLDDLYNSNMDLEKFLSAEKMNKEYVANDDEECREFLDQFSKSDKEVLTYLLDNITREKD